MKKIIRLTATELGKTRYLFIGATLLLLVVVQWRFGLPFVKSAEISEYRVGQHQQAVEFHLPHHHRIDDEIRRSVMLRLDGEWLLYYDAKATSLESLRDRSFWTSRRRVRVSHPALHRPHPELLLIYPQHISVVWGISVLLLLGLLVYLKLVQNQHPAVVPTSSESAELPAESSGYHLKG